MVSSLEPDSRRVPSMETDRHVTRFLSRMRETVIVERAGSDLFTGLPALQTNKSAYIILYIVYYK